MIIQGFDFYNARYKETVTGLYMDRLPHGYVERDGKVYFQTTYGSLRLANGFEVLPPSIPTLEKISHDLWKATLRNGNWFMGTFQECVNYRVKLGNDYER